MRFWIILLSVFLVGCVSDQYKTHYPNGNITFHALDNGSACPLPNAGENIIVRLEESAGNDKWKIENIPTGLILVDEKMEANSGVRVFRFSRNLNLSVGDGSGALTFVLETLGSKVVKSVTFMITAG